jgi:transcriptional regulator with XRE-family HTH domain
MSSESMDLEHRAERVSAALGTAIRARRVASEMTQDELALATGVGRRFLIDLEAGKPTCHLGRSLLVAEALGLRLTDFLTQNRQHVPRAFDLPEPSDEEPDADGPSRLL